VIRLERLDVRGYAQLDGHFEFGPGICVVTGPNEAGKSTLQDALSNAMFGFAGTARRQRGGTSEKDQRHPWRGEDFGVILTMVDRTGRRVRLDWDFARDRVKVLDSLTGDQLLLEQPQQRIDFTTGPSLLGLTREDHQQLGCLFQGGLAPVRASETLRQALQRAVEATASDERGVEGADERLRQLLSRIGVHAGHYGATANGRLSCARAAFTNLQGELTATHEGRRVVEGLVAEHTKLSAQLDDLDRRVLANRQAGLRREADALGAAVKQAAALAVVAGPTDEPSEGRLPPDLPGRVAGARDALARSAAARERARDSVRRALPELEDARVAVRAADGERQALDAYANVDVSAEEDVRDALGRLGGAAVLSDLPPAPAPRDARLARFRLERANLERPIEPTVDALADRSRTLSNTTAAVLAALGIVLGVVVHPIALALLLAAAAVFVLARRTSNAPTVPASSPKEFEGESVAVLAATADAEDRAWLAHEAALAEHARMADQAVQLRTAAAQALRAALGDISAVGDEEGHAREYLRQCDRHRAYVAAAAHAQRAAARERVVAEPEEALRRAEATHAAAEADLRRLLRTAAVDAPDLDEALRRFDDLAGAEAERQEVVAARADAAGRLEQLLAGRTPAELAEKATRALDGLSRHVAQHGELRDGDGTPEAERSGLEERARVDRRLAELATRRQEREEGLKEPADLELQLDAARAEVTSLELYAAAARIARDEIVEAARTAHRRVAPHLNAALAQALPRITRGRYCEAMVDDDLAIRVIAPETGDAVDVERLSRGTRDQIALVQRLELARLLDPTGGGAPLLLDDCFSHTDEHRLPLAVELLVEASRHRQVILFTDDAVVVDAVRASCDDAVVIDLPDPVATVP